MIKKFLKSPNITADWLGVRTVKEVTSHINVRDGKAEPFSCKEDSGLIVEVMKDGHFGYSASSNFSLEGLQKAAILALENAELSQKYSLYSFSRKQVRPTKKGRYSSQANKLFDSQGIGEIYDQLIEVTPFLKSHNDIISTAATAILIENETAMYCSEGSEIFQKHNFVTSDLSSTIKRGKDIQKRSSNLSLQTDLHLFSKENLKERSEKIGREVIELIEGQECPIQTTSVVIAPDQMMLQIHESIGHPLELDRILGDERNYAGWSFVNKEDFGNLQYGSDLLNVVFDPTIDNEFASYGFDEIGNEAKKEYLIEKGILKKGLGSLESMSRLNFEGVANQRASSWNRSPIDRMANINLEPGTKSFDDIISNIEDGIYMETNRSWSIDDFRNKFQFGCEYARKIKNGKLAGVLKNPNYRGISVPFWKSLSAIGNESTCGVHGTMWCGKGEPNQAIRVGHASPLCQFDRVEVFGGAG